MDKVKAQHSNAIPSRQSVDRLQGKIDVLKSDIESHLDKGKGPLMPFLFERVLSHLQHAEKHTNDNSPKAWYEIQMARNALNEAGSLTNENLVRSGERSLRRELHKVWNDLTIVQRHDEKVNTANAADWLTLGEAALEDDPKDQARVLFGPEATGILIRLPTVATLRGARAGRLRSQSACIAISTPTSEPRRFRN